MATVYCARDAELDRSVAVKILAENLAGDPEFRARFVREARLAAKLLHPNVVQIFDAGEDEGRPYIVMEYVEGETLADRVSRQEKLPPAQTVDLALQVCGGLQHAHDQGLVHRDIKPANLLVRTDETVKIADFGIARAAETTALTQIGTVLGTAAYLSPEQAAGEEVTAAADIYSLGAVLYELLTGRTPYEFQSLAELALKQSEGTVTPVRDLEPAVPPALEEAIMRCLARNRHYRPASAAELAQELAAASPEPPTQPLPTWVATGAAAAMAARARVFESIPGRGAATWIVVASIAALVLAGIGLWSFGGSESSPKPAPPAAIPPPVADPAQEARNLRDWLLKNSS